MGDEVNLFWLGETEVRCEGEIKDIGVVSIYRTLECDTLNSCPDPYL